MRVGFEMEKCIMKPFVSKSKKKTVSILNKLKLKPAN